MPTRREVSIYYALSKKSFFERLTYPSPDRQIPTVLSYIDGEEYHGTQAKAQLIRNSKNTVAYFRDFLGKEYVNMF